MVMNCIAATACHLVSLVAVFVSVHYSEEDKNSLDIHDNPPVPDNVVKEDGDTVSDRNVSNTPYHPPPVLAVQLGSLK